jgi:hypothetical protein
MTLDEIRKLTAGQSVGYQRRPNGPVIDATVIKNGPRADDKGNPIPHMLDLLVVQLGSGPTQISWEPENYPEGIVELLPLAGEAVGA